MEMVVVSQQELMSMINNAVSVAVSKAMVSSQQESDSVDIISQKELSKRLGKSVQTIITYTKKGLIPHLAIGSSIMYNFPKVIKALEVENKKKGSKTHA